MTKRKSIAGSAVTIKNAELGEVEAVIATIGVVDHDGDVMLKGAIDDGAKVVISAYGHASWDGALPVGVGTIKEVGQEVVFDGRFFTQTPHGAATFETVKELSAEDLQEWSFSLEEVEHERGKVDGKSVNLISRVYVKEVSPVLRGAGINTRTLATKSVKTLASTVRDALAGAGREAFGGEDVYVYLHDYDEQDSFAIFARYSDTEPEQFARVSFDLSDDGTVALRDDATDVEPVTTFEPKGTKFAELVDNALRSVEVLTKAAVERIACRTEEGKPIDEQIDAVARLDDATASLRKAITKSSSEELEDHTDTQRTAMAELDAELVLADARRKMKGYA